MISTSVDVSPLNAGNAGKDMVRCHREMGGLCILFIGGGEIVF
jgi:hypothetical protein